MPTALIVVIFGSKSRNRTELKLLLQKDSEWSTLWNFSNVIQCQWNFLVI